MPTAENDARLVREAIRLLLDPANHQCASRYDAGGRMPEVRCRLVRGHSWQHYSDMPDDRFWRWSEPCEPMPDSEKAALWLEGARAMSESIRQLRWAEENNPYSVIPPGEGR